MCSSLISIKFNHSKQRWGLCSSDNIKGVPCHKIFTTVAMKSQPFDAKTDFFPDVLLINYWKKKQMHGPLPSEKEVLVSTFLVEIFTMW